MTSGTAFNIPIDGEFLERMDAHVDGFGDPVEQLREALAKDEFELFFQPILALSSADRYPMAEILVRMREEERALLPPGDFLPVLEHYGMMPHLNRWVVSRVIERLARGCPVCAKRASRPRRFSSRSTKPMSSRSSRPRRALLPR